MNHEAVYRTAPATQGLLNIGLLGDVTHKEQDRTTDIATDRAKRENSDNKIASHLKHSRDKVETLYIYSLCQVSA